MLQLTTTPHIGQLDTQKAFLEYANVDDGAYEYKSSIGGYDMHLTTLKYRQDSTAFRESIGLKNDEATLRDSAEAGQKAWQACMDKYAQMGRTLGQLHKKPTIADAFYPFLPINRQYNLQVSGTAEIDWWFDPSERDITFNPGGYEVTNYRPADIEFNYHPCSATYTTTQYANLEMQVVEDK